MNADRLIGRRILIVEDSALLAILLQDMLEDLGCTVSGVAATRDEALVLASSLELDIAILDINIDGLASFPVADLLTERGIRFMFTSGYGSGKVPEHLAAAPYISKPFLAGELEVALRAALA